MIERIVSGAQTGADRAALDWAKSHWASDRIALHGVCDESGGLTTSTNCVSLGVSAGQPRQRFGVNPCVLPLPGARPLSSGSLPTGDRRPLYEAEILFCEDAAGMAFPIFLERIRST